MPAESRAVIVWVPPDQRPEAQEKAARKAKDLEVKDAKQTAELARAVAAEEFHRLTAAARKLVVVQFEKLLKLAEDPDFGNAQGPLDVKDLIRLAALVANEHRLNHGLATANIAHAVTSQTDFSKFTQAERDMWRSLAVKAGAQE